MRPRNESPTCVLLRHPSICFVLKRKKLSGQGPNLGTRVLSSMEARTRVEVTGEATCDHENGHVRSVLSEAGGIAADRLRNSYVRVSVYK